MLHTSLYDLNPYNICISFLLDTLDVLIYMPGYLYKAHFFWTNFIGFVNEGAVG